MFRSRKTWQSIRLPRVTRLADRDFSRGGLALPFAKKPRKASSGQKEILMSIAGKSRRSRPQRQSA
jgi:hypothetical protein